MNLESLDKLAELVDKIVEVADIPSTPGICAVCSGNAYLLNAIESLSKQVQASIRLELNQLDGDLNVQTTRVVYVLRQGGGLLFLATTNSWLLKNATKTT